ncbi:unnamed protein product [Ectocarpus sp. CCAP 1310/34]|nr:unnamed protein product [Ectocarpus sp. CCAP 1310/34]
MREFMETYEGLGGASLPGGVPEAARVGEPTGGGGLSASKPLLAQAHATVLDGVQQPGDAIPAGGGCPAPNPASATPPPVPTKPDSVTAAFLVKERVEGANEAATGEAAADGSTPGTVSSQDLLLEWLRREAGQGDEEAQFHLAQLFSPPRFEMKPKCRECGEDFGVTRYRHHCRHCGGSFCHEHAWHEHPIPKLGLPAPQRVCTPCKHTLELEDWRERVEWRLERVNAFLENRLISYFDTGVDTVGDKALRVVDGAIYVAKSAPLGTAVKVSVEVMDVLMKYGTAGVAGLVLRREFIEAVEVLKRLSGVDKKWPMSVHEMTAAMYYLLAQRRGERGSAPNGEHEAHADCEAISDAELAFLRRMSALPLHFAYTKTALELQVLCNNTGWSLVFHKPDSRFHQPAFSLLACGKTKTASLVVRGTGSIQDVITDIQAMPVPFPSPRGDAESGAAEEADGWSDLPPTETVACSGIARAAEWLHREVVHQLIKLYRENYKIVILGHSLGGGVAALLGVLLKDAIPDVRVVGFATPACADIGVSRLCEGLCTSVVLHDDVVPRITPHAVRALLKDLLCTKEGWVKHLYNDWDAVVGRAKGLWAPRWRMASVAAVQQASGATDSTAIVPAGDTDEEEKASTVKSDGVGAAAAAAAAAASPSLRKTSPLEGGDGAAPVDGGDEWGGRGSPTEVVVAKEDVAAATGSGEETNAGEAVQAKGGRWQRGRWSSVDVRSVQSRLSRIVDDTSARIRSNIVKQDPDSAAMPPPVPPRPAASNNDTNTLPSSSGTGGRDPAGVLVPGKDDDGAGASGGDPVVVGSGGAGSEEEEAEVVEELPLPDLQRGVYRATEVPRDHDTLRTIPMYGNMLADHASIAKSLRKHEEVHPAFGTGAKSRMTKADMLCTLAARACPSPFSLFALAMVLLFRPNHPKRYFDALEEIAAVRAAEAKGEFMPEWVPFSESEVCQLCKADFSWASTSKSERARDKHNCRMCGLLVCDPCSDHRKPLPRVGVLEACRVCDRCFYGADPSRVVQL